MAGTLIGHSSISSQAYTARPRHQCEQCLGCLGLEQSSCSTGYSVPILFDQLVEKNRVLGQ
ncbi:MAG: hypothetical protein ACLT4C_00720 [Butyricicoccus sp.]